MPIITVSRGSYHHGKSISEKLAEELGYACLSRDQLIDELEEFHLPEIKMVRGLRDAISALDRFPYGKERFKAAMTSSVLQHFLPGNIVFHGLVSHYFVRHISHVVKVRVVADTKSRIADEMKRENISSEKARLILKNDDAERRKWGMFLYGIDIQDPLAYNLVVNIGEMSENEAVDIIASVAKLDRFQETDISRKALADTALNARIRNRLFDFPSASIAAKDGEAVIALKVPSNQQDFITERIDSMLEGVDTLNRYTLEFEPHF